jgi:phosphoglycolate phosphatase
MKVKAIIFDLDGTLLDTLDDIKEALNVGLTQYGFEPVSKEFTRSSIGHGAHQLIDTVTLHAEKLVQHNVFQTYQHYYDTHLNIHTKPYDGILNLLDLLISKGIKIGVVSNKHHHVVKQLCRIHFNMIEHVQGMKENIPLKPSPQMILNMMETLQVSPNHTIFVGDSEADIIASQKAKIDVIAVSYGYRDASQLNPLLPTKLCDNVQALTQIIKELI